jgi:hypothetical protein
MLRVLREHFIPRPVSEAEVPPALSPRPLRATRPEKVT